MKTYIFNYKCGSQIIPEEVTESVIGVIDKLEYSLGKYDIRHFKDDLSEHLKMQGWSDKVNLSTKSSISITAMLKKIGLCTQTGNMARMYADLLKLQALYMDKKINAAIFVVPTKECANSFGGNVANSKRLINELTNIFHNVITVPMLIIGFDNEEEII